MAASISRAAPPSQEAGSAPAQPGKPAPAVYTGAREEDGLLLQEQAGAEATAPSAPEKIAAREEVSPPPVESTHAPEKDEAPTTPAHPENSSAGAAAAGGIRSPRHLEDPEEDGMAMRLGLFPRETAAGRAMRDRAAAGGDHGDDAGADGGPSVDEILSRSAAKPLPQEPLWDRLQGRFEKLNSPRPRKWILGTAAALLLGLIAGGILMFRGGAGKGDSAPSASVASEPQPDAAAAAGEGGSAAQAPADTARPAAARGEPSLVIADPGLAPAAAGPSPSDGPGLNSLVADPAADAANAAGAAPAGSGESALVLPPVGAGAAQPRPGGDPLLTDGPPSGVAFPPGDDAGYSVIGGAGETAAAPAGAVVTPPGQPDPETLLGRQESSIQSVAPAAESGAAPASSGEDPRLAGPKEALQRFLAQPTWQERLPYIYQADRLKEQIQAYYATAKDEPVLRSVSRYFDMDEAPQDGGDPFYAFYLSIEGIADEFPVVVRRSPEGYKVDWELFVECKDRVFETFRLSQDPGPATFRLVMQRHSYWGPDRQAFTTSGDFNCYKVEPPYRDNEAFVFVAKDSPLAAEIEQLSTWGLPPVDVVLTLERKEMPHGTRHLVITSLDKTSWVAP